jgi:hypothetical protein
MYLSNDSAIIFSLFKLQLFIFRYFALNYHSTYRFPASPAIEEKAKCSTGT